MADHSAEIAIVGGGAIGTSVLFHLAERHGVTDAVLFEKRQLGSGSTGKAAGGVRNTFTNETNIALGNRNIQFFQDFEKRVGEPLEFRQTGYMYLFHDEEHERMWRDRASFFADHDVNVELLSPEECAEVFEHLDPDSFDGALFAPDCGHVDPHTLTQAYARAAVDRGATVHTKTGVTDVTTDDGRVTGIETEAGTYDVDTILNAAGPWAARLGETVGIDIPIELLLRHIMVTSPVEDANSPLVIDRELDCYFKSEKNGSLLVCDKGQDVHDINDPDTAVSDAIGYDYYHAATEKVEQLIPVLADLDVINGWAGLQSHTPDGHAILGPTAVDGFVLACGMSGHGVQQSPSIGTAIADYLVEGESDILDVELLSLNRFEKTERIEPEGMA